MTPHPPEMPHGTAPHLATVPELFAHLRDRHQLLPATGTSPDGLAEQYLYSPDMLYRYAFARWWDTPQLATTDVWVLLNPATGDTEQRRRPTLERCLARSRAAGRSGIVIVNLFAFRHTDPRSLRQAADPVGLANDAVLHTATGHAARTIVAWGSGGKLHGRSASVAPLLHQPLCLGVTRGGEPRHPLYVPADVEATRWRGPGQV